MGPSVETIDLPWFDGIIVKVGNAMSLLFGVIVAISALELVLRYLFNAPTSWVHESSTFLVGICMMYGGVYCYAYDRHIAMTFIVQSMRARWQWIAAFVVHNLMLLFAIMLTYGAYLSAHDAFIKPNGKIKMQTSGTILDAPFPAIIKAILLICAVLFVILIALKYMRHWRMTAAEYVATQNQDERPAA